MQTLATAHSNDTNDQVDAPTTTAPTAPTFVDDDARERHFIFVKRLISQQASRDLIGIHRAKLLKQQAARYSAAKAALTDALWDGFYELEGDCVRLARLARDEGQLLFAWKGTTVLKGAAE